jgi:hypothetical protein
MRSTFIRIAALAAMALFPLPRALAQLNVLFVVNYADNNGPIIQITDQAIKQRLERTFGATVTLIDDNSGPELFAAGRGLVVVSGTVGSVPVAGLGTLDVPLLNMESGAFIDYKMVPAAPTGGGSTNFESLVSQGVEILPTSHPLAAGLSPGFVSPYNFTPWDRVAGTNPGANAVVAARIPGTGTPENPTRAAVFGYDSGVLMADGVSTFTKRRTGLFVGDDAEGFFLNETGARLFDAAVAWTANLSPVPAGVVPGDANDDAKASFLDYKIWKNNTGTGLPVFNFGSGGEDVGNFNHDNLVNLSDRAIWEANWLTGDINDDNIVNAVDVSQVAANWGTMGPNGDANLDMTIDIFDVARISANWNNTAGIAATQSFAAVVPEPSGVQLAASLGVMLGLGAYFRRRGAACRNTRRLAPAALLVLVTLLVSRPASALEVLILTGDAPTPDNLNRMVIVGDQAIGNRLQNTLGATIEYVDDDFDADGLEGPLTVNDSIRAAAVGKDLVIITRNVNTAKVALTFALRDNPIMLFHDDLLDEYRFAPNEGGDAYTQQINITGSGNVLTAGLPNQTTNFYLYNNFRIGGTDNDVNAVPPSAIVGAVRTSSPTRRVIFGYDHSSTMANSFVNVGRRTFFGTHALSSPMFMTNDAWALFDAAVLWTADEAAVSNIPEPGAGVLAILAALSAPILVRARRRRVAPSHSTISG